MIFCISFSGLTAPKAKTLSCDESLMASTKVIAGAPDIYQLKYSNYSLEIGGAAEKFSGAVDKEAIKRILIQCSPGIVRCLKAGDRKTKKYDMTLSFEVKPAKFSYPSKIKITSPTIKSAQMRTCIEGVWSNVPLPTGTDVIKATVPLQIR